MSPTDLGRIFALLKGEPQGPLGVEAFQRLLWPRGRGGRLGLGGLARGRGFRRPRPGPAPAAMRPAQTELWLRLVVALGLALVGPLPVGWSSARAPIYVSSWAVRVSQGYREAERLARKFGFVNLGQVGRTQMDRKGGAGRPQTPETGGVPKISRTPSPPLPRPTSDSGTSRGHLVGGRMQARGVGHCPGGFHLGARCHGC